MAAKVLISTHGIGKSYGAEPLFTDISLQVLEDDRLGLIGPNGAGKSTLLKILSGMESVDSGEISRKRGTHYFADHDQWLQYRKERAAAGGRPGKTGQDRPKEKSRKLAFEERKKLGRIERQIEKAEGLADDLQRQLYDPAITSAVPA